MFGLKKLIRNINTLTTLNCRKNPKMITEVEKALGDLVQAVQQVSKNS